MKKITKSIMLLLILACLSNTSYSSNGKEKQSVKYSQGKGEGQIESMSYGGRYRGYSVSNISWKVRCRGWFGTCFTVIAHTGYTEVLMGNGDYFILNPPPVSNPSQGTELDPVEGGNANTYTLEIPIADISKWNPATQSWESVTECNIWIVEP